MSDAETKIKELQEKLANTNFLLAAVVEALGGLVVVEAKDLEKVRPRETMLTVMQGSRKGDIIIRAVKTGM